MVYGTEIVCDVIYMGLCGVVMVGILGLFPFIVGVLLEKSRFLSDSISFARLLDIPVDIG